MKVLIVDDQQKRATQLAELVRSRKVDAVVCCGSNEFMDALQGGSARAMLLDMETWRKGRSVYGYFGVARKLVDVPVVFYNAPEGFTALPDRPRLDKDTVLPTTATVETIAESLAVVA
jgi:hypothetical protein